MIEALQATIDPDGTIRLDEPIRFPSQRRALVIVLEDGASTAETAVLSERALAADWDRAEEASSSPRATTSWLGRSGRSRRRRSPAS